mmetsp:Transcript_138073/g.253968  ORF Transcript_138073/g.253968 Transcript_138073/m.253968 type:complete len:80 (-) Transcript_138073:3-242(-)
MLHGEASGGASEAKELSGESERSEHTCSSFATTSFTKSHGVSILKLMSRAGCEEPLSTAFTEGERQVPDCKVDNCCPAL